MLLFEQDIPTYLHSSPFLQGLLMEGPFPEAGIEIPDVCLKKNTEVASQEDLNNLLHTLRFWLFPELLNDNVDFVSFALDPSKVDGFFSSSWEFRNEFPVVKEVFEIIVAKPDDQLTTATSYGRMYVIRHLVDELHYPVTEAAGAMAASRCNFQCLEYFRSRGMKLSLHVCFGACVSNDLSMVKYMIDNQAQGVRHIATSCAVTGSFECVKYAMENVNKCAPYDIAMAFELAAEHGHIDLLIQMRAEWQDPVHDSYDSNIVFYGAQHGQLDVLKFAREGNFPMKHFHNALRAAAMAKDERCLQFIHELGCELTHKEAEMAAERGHLPVLRYLLEHNCPVNDEICKILARLGQPGEGRSPQLEPH